jgi:hypothetical protein
MEEYKCLYLTMLSAKTPVGYWRIADVLIRKIYTWQKQNKKFMMSSIVRNTLLNPCRVFFYVCEG